MPDEMDSWLADTLDIDTAAENESKKSFIPAKRVGFSSTQMVILGLLALVLCGVFGGLGTTIYLNLDELRGTAPQNVAVAPPPPAPPLATPTIEVTPTSTDIPTPAPTSTSMLPQAAPTAEPSATATYAVDPAFINKDKISEIAKFVEVWRELSLPQDVPIEFLTRRQLQEQWRDEAFDVAALQAVQTQQDFYRVMGLIEPDVDLVEAAFDSQTDILMGYYTPEEKAMYIIAESVNMFANEEMTFAHEYVHALQDYHFDLSNIITTGISGDAMLAARSLPEGDARAIESIFTSQNITPDQIDYSIYRYLFQEHPTLEGVSPALGIFTFFPYSAGEYFVFYLLIEGGYTWDLVNDAYTHPPVSSEQVMHPEKYLAGEAPVAVVVPDLSLALGEGWQEIDQDVLGEVGFLVWLIDQVEDQDAIDGAAGWGGDTYTLWVNDADQRVLAELSVWETEADAIQLHKAFSMYMNLREGETNSTEESDATSQGQADASQGQAGTSQGQAGTSYWHYDDGVTMLTRTKQNVLIIIAPDRETLDSIHAQFSGF